MRRVIAIAGLLMAVAACESAPFDVPRWVPPVPGPIPEVVSQRPPLPFCGVATHEQDPVLRCMLDALRARRPAEVGVMAGPEAANQTGIVRLLPDMSVELLIYRDRRWQRTTCTGLREEQPPAVINVADCADPVDLPA